MYGHYIVPLLNAGYIDKMDSQKENPRAEGILKGFRVYSMSETKSKEEGPDRREVDERVQHYKEWD